MSNAAGQPASPHARPPGGGGRPAATPAPELQYAPRPPLRRRPAFRRAVLLLCLLIAVGAGVRWFPQAREHVLVQVWQRRCLDHNPPADEVVYDTGAGRAAALLKDRRYQAVAGSGSGGGACLVPAYWSDLYAHLSPPGLKSQGTVFLGRMTTPGGEERLVAIDLVVEGRDNVLLMARVVAPGSLVRKPRLVSTIGGRFISYGLLDGPVTPARVDPKDPTRLVLFGGRIDAWLRDNGGLNLRPGADEFDRDAPVRAPAPTRPSTSPATR